MDDVIYDIETDNLLDYFSKVHSLVLRDIPSDEVLSCTDASSDYASIDDGLQALSRAKRIYGHNIFRFDLPVLKHKYGWEPKKSQQLFDTITMTRTRWAHIKRSDFGRAKKGKLPSYLIGRHSLEAWGYRLGEHKGEYTDWCKANGIEDPWLTWRPEMQTYCEQDTAVNRALVFALRKAGAMPPSALFPELELQRYLAQQERNGWPFDVEGAQELVADLSAQREEIGQRLKDHFGLWFVPGEEFTPKVTNSRYHYVKGATLQRLEWKEFNPASRDHIADRLQKVYGWEPKRFTPTGKPQVDEKALLGLEDIPIADDLMDYLVVDKMLGYVSEGRQAWLKHHTKDGIEGGQLTGHFHIHHSISQKAVTHRGIHSHPNLGQVPKKGKWGKMSRALFYAPDGWVHVGADASGLEMRCLAHYLARYDDGAFGQAILTGDKEKGTDQHSRNAEILDLSRDDGKTWFYAWLYGAGNPKLGSIKKPGAPESVQAKIGARDKKRFLKTVPGLEYLVNTVKAKADNPGWVIAPDGRRVYVRHRHAALNTLLQSAGNIIVENWIVEFNRRLMEIFDTPFGGGWDYGWAALGWIHDEVQLAVRPDNVPAVRDVLLDSMHAMREKFDWRLPLDAEVLVGRNWRDTH